MLDLVAFLAFVLFFDFNEGKDLYDVIYNYLEMKK